MAASPTPSLESLPGANSIGSFGEPTDYLSDSPLTLSGSSPPVSDSALCDDFSSGLPSSLDSQNSQTSSSATNSNTPGNTRCTGCKSKQSDAVAKCIDCANYLCSNCVTAHQFMHCFDGHSVFRIKENGQTTISSSTATTTLNKTTMNSFDTSRHSNIKDDLSKLTLNNLIISPALVNSLGSSLGLSIGDQQTQSTTLTNSLTPAPSSNGVINSTGQTKINNNIYYCQRHNNELLKFFCRTCSVPVCKDCIVLDHPSGIHDCEHTMDTSIKQIESLSQTVVEVRSKINEMRTMVKNAEHNTSRIQSQYQKAQTEITETFQFYRSMLDERKAELLKELESFYKAKTMSQSVLMTKSQEQIDKFLQSCEVTERLMKHAGLNETIMLRKLMETKLQSIPSFMQELQSTYELEFVSNYQAIQVGVRNTFGYIRSNAELSTKQPPIARPTSGILTNGSSASSSSSG